MLRETDFRHACRQYLSSSQPIRSAQHLKGRAKVLKSVVHALNAPGKHVFIYGSRGVGKTSLAVTAASEVQPTLPRQNILACDSSTTFESLCVDAIKRLAAISPLERKISRKFSVGGTFKGFGANINLDGSRDPHAISIATVNDAVLALTEVWQKIGHECIVIVDEFDFWKPKTDHEKLAILLKQLSDQNIDIKFIFCGISEKIDELFKSHESAHRYIHAEKLEPLSLGASIEIIEDASDAIEIKIPRHMQYRISQIADGYPYFVHLICEKLFSSAYEASNNCASPADFHTALDDAIASIEPRLKNPFEDSVLKNTKNSEYILWALANDDLLEVQVSDIWNHYDRICTEMHIASVSKANVITKLNNLCKETHGCLLSKPRRSYYTFSEKMMRGYARLRAARAGLTLGPENPGA